ncbi:4994_t:CDS:2, partial [Dentiscutata heterogama]
MTSSGCCRHWCRRYQILCLESVSSSLPEPLFELEFVLLSVHHLGVIYSVLVLSVLAGEAVCGTLLVLNALLIVLFFFRAFMEFVD